MLATAGDVAAGGAASPSALVNDKPRPTDATTARPNPARSGFHGPLLPVEPAPPPAAALPAEAWLSLPKG